MTYTPQPLKDLRTAFVGWTGCPRENFSIARSCQPGRGFRGYHLGKDQIFGSQGSCVGQRWDDYSVKTARDKAGLSDARAAIDIQFNRNTLDRGAAKLLREFSTWLVAQCQANAAGTADIREVIYSPDGTTVLRYDRERGIKSAPKPGEADKSHTWHTHVSFYRDSEARAKTPTFAGYFKTAPAPESPPSEPEVQPVTVDEIKQLQQLLNSLGATPALVVDGLFGPKTRAALVAALTTAPQVVLAAARQKTAIGEAINTLEAVR
ncbi:MAG TPA: peptidoglycan-binding protein [Candidatus Limnocylindrales bacterium]|nr:peptidoglycan-binding protein [Candidatus Limnocylindrales bacterium]